MLDWLLAGGCRLKEIRKKTNKGRGPLCIGEGDVEQTLRRCLKIEIREGKF
jgi:hypothetical protein